jgi:hypothetical protein
MVMACVIFALFILGTAYAKWDPWWIQLYRGWNCRVNFHYHRYRRTCTN